MSWNLAQGVALGGVTAENKGGLYKGLGNVILFSNHMSTQVSLLAHSREL